MIKKTSILLACILFAGALFGCSRSSIPEQVTQRPVAESEQVVTEQADGTKEMAIGTEDEYTKITFSYSKNSKYTGLPLLYTLELFLTPQDGKYVLEREPFDSALKEIAGSVSDWQGETEEEPGWVLATLYSIPASVGIYQLAQ